jgi:hypothetical protein
MTERKRPPGKPTTEEMLARFKGRSRKGRPNRVSAMLKEAMLEAPAIKGYDGHGLGGLTGWLLKQAEDYPQTYLKLLSKVLPMEMQVQMAALQLHANASQQGSQPQPHGGYVLNAAAFKPIPSGSRCDGLAAHAAAPTIDEAH